MSGYVYMISDGKYVKIGHSADPAARLRSLQTGSATELHLLAQWPGTQDDERKLHGELAQYREVGEWFALPPREVAALAMMGTSPTASAERVVRCERFCDCCPSAIWLVVEGDGGGAGAVRAVVDEFKYDGEAVVARSSGHHVSECSGSAVIYWNCDACNGRSGLVFVESGTGELLFSNSKPLAALVGGE